MTFAAWLPDRLHDYGLAVREHPGWGTRGSSDFNPQGLVVHHTASASGSNAPALDICVNGRPDLPGPLCHVLLARDGTCYVIAAGRANHAGDGGWRGLSGNSSVLGIEAENNGVGEPWPEAQLDAFHRASAALLDGCGAGTEMCCYHREWTSRKIDPAGPGIPQDGDVFRAAVQTARDGGDMPLSDGDLFKVAITVNRVLDKRDAEENGPEWVNRHVLLDVLQAFALESGVDMGKLRSHLSDKTKAALDKVD